MPPQKLYHYTSASGAGQIQRDGTIKANNGKCGHGVYLTALGPRTDKSRLLKNNQDCRPGTDGRVAYYFEFQASVFSKLFNYSEPGRDIWLVPQDVPVQWSVHGGPIEL